MIINQKNIRIQSIPNFIFLFHNNISRAAVIEWSKELYGL